MRIYCPSWGCSAWIDSNGFSLPAMLECPICHKSYPTFNVK